jgi:YD repeat-containing protein
MRRNPLWSNDQFLSDYPTTDSCQRERIVLYSVPGSINNRISVRFFTFFVIAILFVCHSGVRAQTSDPVTDLINKSIPQPVPKSPNVAALEKFGTYGVSFFSGLPEISIPITTISSGSLSFPVSLSYHASGVKPSEQISWVGCSFGLNAGFSVNRNVHGKPDEEDYYNRTLVSSPSTCTSFYFLDYAATNVIDTEADVFSYSTPSASGKFTLKNGSAPFLFPQTPVVINPTYSNNLFTKFEITDESGVLYRFGQNAQGVNATEYTHAVNGGAPSLRATTAWHITDMIAPDNAQDQVSFSYQNVGTATTHDVSYTYVLQTDCDVDNYSDPENPDPTQNTNQCPTRYAYLSDPNYSDSDIDQLGVKTITFKTGKVDFILGATRTDQPQLKSLDSVKVYSLNNGKYTLTKAIKFVYSYFGLPNISSTAVGPLRLDAVQFFDNAGKLIEQYKLTYTTNSFSWTSNPNARDLWGYYNGANQNTDLLLPTTVQMRQTLNGAIGPVSFGGAFDRTVNTQYAQEGVLSRIDFPTGGYTTFSYQSNQYLNTDQGMPGVPTYVGGLRVYKIVSTADASSPAITKTYKYGSNEDGYGMLNSRAYDFNYNTSQMYRRQACAADESQVTAKLIYNIHTYYSNTAISTEDSAPIMYMYVSEYEGDYAGNNLGKTVYEYDNGVPLMDNDRFVTASNKFFRNSSSWQRGKLTHKTVFDNAGNKLHEMITSYNVFNSSDIPMGLGVYNMVTPILTGVCGGPTCTDLASGDVVYSDQFQFNDYAQSTGAKLETQVTEYDYESGNTNKYVMKQTTTAYEPTKLRVSQTTVTDNTVNDQVVTVNHYPFQLSANTFSAGSAKGVYMLNTKNIVGHPFETYSYLQNVDGSNQRLVSSHLTTYRQNENNSDQVVEDQVYIWESPSPVALSGYVPATVNAGNNGLTMDANLKSRVSILSYDGTGNVLSASRSNDVAVAYLYGYNNNSLPVAEIKNVQNSQVRPLTPTGVVPISLGGPSNTVTQTYTFMNDYTGPVTLKLGVSGSPAYTLYASWTGLAAGNSTLSPNGCSIVQFTVPNVPRGSHSVTITISSSQSGILACGEIDYPKNSGTSEVLFENFEDYDPSQIVSNASLSHTGINYFNGDYTVSFTAPNSRAYKIEYWYYNNGTWTYITKPYTGSSMVLSEGSAIDDVRIYPTDAQMKTYTHDPLLGLTSVTDESGFTQRYEYDTYGRLKLIRDDQGKILKSYQYHYKNN